MSPGDLSTLYAVVNRDRGCVSWATYRKPVDGEHEQEPRFLSAQGTLSTGRGGVAGLRERLYAWRWERRYRRAFADLGIEVWDAPAG